jgi:hypothetical protein
MGIGGERGPTLFCSIRGSPCHRLRRWISRNHHLHHSFPALRLQTISIWLPPLRLLGCPSSPTATSRATRKVRSVSGRRMTTRKYSCCLQHVSPMADVRVLSMKTLTRTITLPTPDLPGTIRSDRLPGLGRTEMMMMTTTMTTTLETDLLRCPLPQLDHPRLLPFIPLHSALQLLPRTPSDGPFSLRLTIPTSAAAVEKVEEDRSRRPTSTSRHPPIPG